MSTHTENVSAYRDALIANAVKARKIAADRADDYRKMFDASPGSIAHLLTAPVKDGGLMAGINVGGDPFPKEPTEYPKHWIQAGSSPTGSVIFEDQAAAMDGLSMTPPAPSPAPGGTVSSPRITFEP